MSTTHTTAAAEVIEHIDPTTLHLGTNVRRDAQVDPELVASIAAGGVREPVTAYRDGETLVVLRGQRRTLAAREAKAATIPVRVIARPEEVERIGDQLVENLHRRSMRPSDLTLAIQGLAELGESDTKIARRLGHKREAISRQRAASSAPAALEALDAGTLTLDHAALIIRADRAEAAAWQIEAQAWREQGWHVQAREDGGFRRNGEGILSVAAYVDEQGNAAAVTEQTPRETVTVALIAQDVEGEQITWRTEYGVLAPAALGWTTLVRWREQHGADEGEVAALTAEAEEAEAKRQERREVIAGNKAWDAAADVRAQWLTEWAKSKAAPTGAEQFLARVVMRHPGALSRITKDGHPSLAAALDKTPESPWGPTLGKLPARADKAKAPKAALMLVVAAVLMSWQEGSGRHTWRNPTQQDQLMLSTLIAWGYQASEIEQAIAKGKTPRV